MTDERHVFIEDVTERSRNAKGYYNSNGKQRPMAIDQSKLPEAVTNERDGECTSVLLDRPMTKDEFLKLSDSLMVEYLNHLVDKYGIGKPSIDNMLGTCRGWLDQYIKTKKPNLAAQIHKGSHRPTNEQGEAWKEFCKKNDPKPEPVSITRPSGYELVADALVRTANGVPTETLARSYDMTLRQFRMTFQFEYTKIIREPGTELYQKLKGLMANLTDPIKTLYQLYGISVSTPKFDSDAAMTEEQVGDIMKKIEKPVMSKKEWKDTLREAIDVLTKMDAGTSIETLATSYGMTVGKLRLFLHRALSHALNRMEEKSSDTTEEVETPDMSKKEWEDEFSRDESAIAPSSMQLQFASVDNWESLFETLRGIPLPKNAMITIQVRESVTGEV